MKNIIILIIVATFVISCNSTSKKESKMEVNQEINRGDDAEHHPPVGAAVIGWHDGGNAHGRSALRTGRVSGGSC